MLARRLLLATAGASGFVGAASAEEDMRVVAFLTRLSNYVVTEDTSFPFDTSRVMDSQYFTWAGVGNPLVCQTSSWYWLHGNFTTLGTDYGGAANSDWLAAVTVNGLALANFVVAERHAHSSSATADLMSIGSPVYLSAGAQVRVIFQNLNGANTTLLVESNPSDGVPSGYLADEGPGTLSPHLIVVKLSGSAPS